MIVYLRCSINNLLSIVCENFFFVVSSFGLFLRVRFDKGIENVEVVCYMLSYFFRGINRGSYIVGRSVYNQRIERFWRDMFFGCVYFFYYLFYELENYGMFDFLNEFYLFVFYFIYVLRINRNL